MIEHRQNKPCVRANGMQPIYRKNIQVYAQICALGAAACVHPSILAVALMIGIRKDLHCPAER
jgi:hypothetical protein